MAARRHARAAAFDIVAALSDRIEERTLDRDPGAAASPERLPEFLAADGADLPDFLRNGRHVS